MAFLTKYNVARHIYIPIVKRAVVDFAVGADWTPAAGDVKVSKDGGAAANIGTLPSAITMGNTAIWDFTLTSTELSAAQIVVTVADAATKAVEDQSFYIETYGNASAQHPVDFADSVRAGLTALPATAAGANTGLPLVGSQIPNATAAANGGLATCDANNSVKTQGNVKKNTALSRFMFLMTDSTNHNPATGKTVTVQRSLDGVTFGGGTLSAVTEVGNGIYYVDFLAADLNANVIILRATATGCDDTFERIITFV